jgi:hypothetical protein
MRSLLIRALGVHACLLGIVITDLDSDSDVEEAEVKLKSGIEIPQAVLRHLRKDTQDLSRVVAASSSEGALVLYKPLPVFNPAVREEEGEVKDVGSSQSDDIMDCS